MRLSSIILFILPFLFLSIIPIQNTAGDESIFFEGEKSVFQKKISLKENWDKVITLDIEILEGWQLINSDNISCGETLEIRNTIKTGTEKTLETEIVTKIGGLLGLHSFIQIGIDLSERTEYSISMNKEEEVIRTWKISSEDNIQTNWKIYQKYQRMIFISETTTNKFWGPESKEITTHSISKLNEFDSPQEKIPIDCGYSLLEIPDWVKNNSRWWSEGKILGDEFMDTISFLVDAKIIDIQNLPKQFTGEPDGVIPDWVKNNTEWWSHGKIDNQTFVSGMKYLIENGIIKLKMSYFVLQDKI